ncbi:MAG: HAD-IA family hydrolase [Chloroflexi bacterium]|nr:HAD-IA family hydrolase [Chloroflexota bacterium]
MHPPELVVFDLGGVLVRIARSWAEAHERAGLPPHQLPGHPEWEAGRLELARAHQVGAIDPPTWAARVAALSGGAYTPEEATRLLEAWQLGEYPGVGRVLDLLERRGIGSGALSNTNALHWAALRPASGPAAYPTVARLRLAFASHELGLMKPDPAIYEHVERATGATPGRVLFFDDLAPNVEGARARGWQAVRVDPERDTTPQLLEALRAHGIE